MDLTRPQSDSPETGFLLLEDAKHYLQLSGKWARFTGITGFVGTALLLFTGVFFGAIISIILPYKSTLYPAFFGELASLGFLIMGIVSFFMSLNLYQLGSNLKQGIELENAVQVSKALGKLRHFFKVKGILLLAILVIYVLSIITGVVLSAGVMIQR